MEFSPSLLGGRLLGGRLLAGRLLAGRLLLQNVLVHRLHTRIRFGDLFGDR